MDRLPPFISPSEPRSANMRAIRSAGNKSTEARLKALFREHGIHGWRLHPPDLLGRPDVLIRGARVVIFLDGCFWHGCPRCGHIPRTNAAYWKAKIGRNKARDAVVTSTLRKEGFHVIRLWECDLKSRPKVCIRRIQRTLQKTAK